MFKSKEEKTVTELTPQDLDSVSGGVAGPSVSHGSFQSNTGTGLNILVDWIASDGGPGGKTLEVDVSAISYSLYAIALPNGVQLSVNGAVYTSGSKAVSYGGRSKVTNPLASFTVPNVSGTLQLSASWYFNGTYSGTHLTTIRADATITI